MAVFKQIVQVNNGNTGWTRGDVITALEQVFANLGWHGGSAKTGVVQSVIPPYYSGTTPGWYNQIPAVTSPAVNNKAWTVTVSGSAYSFTQTAGTGGINGNNANIVCNQGDTISFNITATGSPFYIVWDNTGGYSASKVLNGDYSSAPTYSVTTSDKLTLGSTLIKNLPSAQGVENGTVTWDTTNVLNGTYYYVCGTNSAMTGTITVNPRPAGSSGVELADALGARDNGWFGAYNHNCFYDYTVPASGGKSAATFRVYRNSNGRISGINIIKAQETYGWNGNESFTIPGDQIGGSTPTHDVVFGVLSSTNPSIRVTDLGAGTSFYQKNTSEGWAVLRAVNNSNKRFGTTYYTFSITPNVFDRLAINSGPNWLFANTKRPYSYNDTYGPGSNSSQAFDTPGCFEGVAGVEFSEGYRNINISGPYNYSKYSWNNYCRSSSPTSYPLAIRVYRAQSPQDGNFAIIQFTQTVNTIVETYATFFLHYGPNYGAGIWDLDHVYQGGWTYVASESNEVVSLRTTGQHGGFSSYYTVDTESQASTYRRSRESLYGYQRDISVYDGNEAALISKYQNNIYNDSSEPSSMGVIYYRSSSVDSKAISARPGEYNFSSSSNYYKAIKGLPLCISMIPQPYYLPDDFTMIQFLTTPGQAQFRTGDTITISPSESYEIVMSSYRNDQTDPFGASCAKGIAFCCRVV